MMLLKGYIIKKTAPKGGFFMFYTNKKIHIELICLEVRIYAVTSIFFFFLEIAKRKIRAAAERPIPIR